MYVSKLSTALTRLAQVQFANYSFAVERSFLIAKERLANQLEVEKAKINARYDGSAVKELEAEIQRAADQKLSVANALGNVGAALVKVTSVREQLVILRDAAVAGTTSSFDTALDAINIKVGSANRTPSNLVGTVGYGRTGSRTVSTGLTGADQAFFKTQSLGSQYYIQLSTGEQIRPNIATRTFEYAGTTYNFTDPTAITRTGDAISFTVGGQALSGTFKPGGLSIGSAWTYDNLAVGAERDKAVADANAAIAVAKDLNLKFLDAQLVLQRGLGSIQLKLGLLGGQTKEVLALEIKERDAALKAAETRMKLGELQISLLGKSQINQVKGLLAEEPFWKKGLFDLIGGR